MPPRTVDGLLEDEHLVRALIQHIRNQPALYDLSAAGRTSRAEMGRQKQEAWRSIVQQLHNTVDVNGAQQVWRRLIDRFSKELKRRRQSSSPCRDGLVGRHFDDMVWMEANLQGNNVIEGSVQQQQQQQHAQSVHANAVEEDTLLFEQPPLEDPHLMAYENREAAVEFSLPTESAVPCTSSGSSAAAIESTVAAVASGATMTSLQPTRRSSTSRQRHEDMFIDVVGGETSSTPHQPAQPHHQRLVRVVKRGGGNATLTMMATDTSGQYYSSGQRIFRLVHPSKVTPSVLRGARKRPARVMSGDSSSLAPPQPPPALAPFVDTPGTSSHALDSSIVAEPSRNTVDVSLESTEIVLDEGIAPSEHHAAEVSIGPNDYEMGGDDTNSQLLMDQQHGLLLGSQSYSGHSTTGYASSRQSSSSGLHGGYQHQMAAANSYDNNDVELQQYIASRLATMNDDEKAVVKLHIQRIMLDSRFGRGESLRVLEVQEKMDAASEAIEQEEHRRMQHSGAGGTDPKAHLMEPCTLVEDAS